MTISSKTTLVLLLSLLLTWTGVFVVEVSGQGAEKKREECLILSEIKQIDRKELKDFDYGLVNDGYYFCAANGPKQFQCNCGATQYCRSKMDPFDRDIGECVCCSGWVIAMLLLFLILLGGSLLIALYGCLCRGRWWCDGHPPPFVPLLARRGAPVVVPSQMPLPSNIFRGYRSSDFDSGLPPGAAEAEAERRELRRRRREAERQARRRRVAESNEGGSSQGGGAGRAEGGSSNQGGEGAENTATAATTGNNETTRASPVTEVFPRPNSRSGQ